LPPHGFLEPFLWGSQRAMSISRPRKLLVYLDQNFISEMAKPARPAAHPDFKELYRVLQTAFWNEQLVVLRSRFHDVETSLLAADALKDAIKAMKFTNVMGKTVTFDDHNSAGRFVVLQTVIDKKVGVADIVEVK
jgi:chromatin segregation and condensation protein Rec8/ScpA/Scc1 (kleisin family)